MSEKTPHVMIDLETMDVGPKSAVVSIGAVKFLPLSKPGEFVSTFEVTISLRDCLKHGLTVNGSTVEWWLKQSDAARASLKFEHELRPALLRFLEWYGPTSLPTWGNAPSFDCTILRSALDAAGYTVPWKFRDEMCFRTLVKLFPSTPRAVPVVAHDALNDAMAQAITVQAIYVTRRGQE